MSVDGGRPPAAFSFSFSRQIYRFMGRSLSQALSGQKNLALSCPSLVQPNPFRFHTYGPLRMCGKQRTYGSCNSFRCNTYKKTGGRWVPLRLQGVGASFTDLGSNSFAVTFLANPHILTPYPTISYKNHRGRGGYLLGQRLQLLSGPRFSYHQKQSQQSCQQHATFQRNRDPMQPPKLR
jgi:hypothetical protein